MRGRRVDRLLAGREAPLLCPGVDEATLVNAEGRPRKVAAWQFVKSGGSFALDVCPSAVVMGVLYAPSVD